MCILEHCIKYICLKGIRKKLSWTISPYLCSFWHRSPYWRAGCSGSGLLQFHWSRGGAGRSGGGKLCTRCCTPGGGHHTGTLQYVYILQYVLSYVETKSKTMWKMYTAAHACIISNIIIIRQPRLKRLPTCASSGWGSCWWLGRRLRSTCRASRIHPPQRRWSDGRWRWLWCGISPSWPVVQNTRVGEVVRVEPGGGKNPHP